MMKDLLLAFSLTFFISCSLTQAQGVWGSTSTPTKVTNTVTVTGAENIISNQPKVEFDFTTWEIEGGAESRMPAVNHLFGIMSDGNSLKFRYGSSSSYSNLLASLSKEGNLGLYGNFSCDHASLSSAYITGLVDLTNYLWVRPVGKVSLGSLHPSATSKDFTVGFESEFTNDVTIGGQIFGQSADFQGTVWTQDAYVQGTLYGLGTPNFRKLILKDQVQIGNTIPGSSSPHNNFKLSVDGKVVAKEVIVTDLNWADYVFDDDYELASLGEVESFIKENGHLPGVPSSYDVKNDGISLGEMNRILLEKLEELTVHIIELEKRIGEK